MKSRLLVLGRPGARSPRAKGHASIYTGHEPATVFVLSRTFAGLTPITCLTTREKVNRSPLLRPNP